jgi:hypothetical protein
VVDGFKTKKLRHVAALLVNSPMSTSELLEIVGGDKTTLKRSLKRLHERGLVDFVASTETATCPGHPAGLWSLTAAGHHALAHPQLCGDDSLPWEMTKPALTIRQHQTWVIARFRPSLEAKLASLLSTGALTAASSWIVRLDGEDRSYLFAFDTFVGDQPPENLRAALNALGAHCTLASVGRADPPPEFVASIQTATAVAKRALSRVTGCPGS